MGRRQPRPAQARANGADRPEVAGKVQSLRSTRHCRESKKMSDTSEIFEYELKDENGEFKPRIVVFKDREVIFYGKQSEKL